MHKNIDIFLYLDDSSSSNNYLPILPLVFSLIFAFYLPKFITHHGIYIFIITPFLLISDDNLI